MQIPQLDLQSNDVMVLYLHLSRGGEYVEEPELVPRPRAVLEEISIDA